VDEGDKWSEGSRYICLKCGKERYIVTSGSSDSREEPRTSDELSDTNLSTWWYEHYDVLCEHLWVETWFWFSSPEIEADGWPVDEPDLIQLYAPHRKMLDEKYAEDAEVCRLYIARRLHDNVKQDVISRLEQAKEILAERIRDKEGEEWIAGAEEGVRTKELLLTKIIASEEAMDMEDE
jgi:hypothetical protein